MSNANPDSYIDPTGFILRESSETTATYEDWAEACAEHPWLAYELVREMIVIYNRTPAKKGRDSYMIVPKGMPT